ncbi:hypothetical protein [Streptomyces sp. NPDC056192]|uniref:hypothetical protein n=1 Tax=Streptomyces sp. NPDC056192 TaxID=3345743 RepID=UPI0035DB72C3
MSAMTAPAVGMILSQTHPLSDAISSLVDEAPVGLPQADRALGGAPSSAGSALPDEQVGWTRVLGKLQDVRYTRSRRAEPRAWTRSVVWLIEAGLHPKAGATTLVVARDLAARMDYRRGLVMYDLDGTVVRTGLSRATVKRHVKFLRELGALAWWRHGSKRNLRLPGRAYTATATIYGAVVPPLYDFAMGHWLTGAGYEGRVCGVTEAGRERAVAASAARHGARRGRTGVAVRSDVGRPHDAVLALIGCVLWITRLWIRPVRRAVSPILVVVTTDHLKLMLRVVVETPRASARAAEPHPLPLRRSAATAMEAVVPPVRRSGRSGSLGR